ncbi:MAG: hypothetical protein JXB34_09625 [Bacteroidales bacterium]|nr:hypothetical protein [Bacteroidales bacterium]
MKGISTILVTALTAILLMPFNIKAQTGRSDGSRFGHGEDSIRCLRNNSLYRENIRNNDIITAYGYWVPVFDECPQVSKNLYLDGAKIYRYFLDNETNPKRYAELSDTLMLIYDQRIEYFGEKGKVRGFQGADLLKYRRNDGIEFVQQGYNYLKESLELKEDDASRAVLPTLLSASITLYKDGKLSAKQTIEDYIQVSEIIDKMIMEKPGDEKLAELKSSLDNNFVSEGPGDCDALIEYFTGEHQSKKNDAAFLTMLTNLLSARKCTDADLYFVSIKDLFKLAPSSESAVNIALYARDKWHNEEAIAYFKQALEMETDENKKADYHLGMAISYQRLENKPAAREAALKAAAARPGFGEPYILIGQLYADSKNECAGEKLPNAIFWVAVDMFIKAKTIDATLEERANKLIATYSPYYPDKEKAFFENILEGSTYTIGCWINETTRVRF